MTLGINMRMRSLTRKFFTHYSIHETDKCEKDLINIAKIN